MDRVYKNKWDKFSLIVTIIVSVIVIVSIWLSVRQGGVLAIIISFVLLAFFLISILLRPIRTIYSGDDIVVDFPFWKKVIKMSQYSPLIIEKMSAIKSIRLFANGGYFGYSGIWRMYVSEKNKWVTVNSYATSKDEDVVLLLPITGKGKCILVNLYSNYLTDLLK